MKIYIDADACPVPVKEMVYKASQRLNISVILVANQYIRPPLTDLIQSEVVPGDPDAADDRIVELMDANDLVITADIPLADRVVKKGGFVIEPRGSLLDANTIGQRLAVRNLMDDLRTEGQETSFQKAFGNKEKQAFANQLDRFLTNIFQRKA